MNKVWLVLQKELRELLPQRVMLLTLPIMPLILVSLLRFFAGSALQRFATPSVWVVLACLRPASPRRKLHN